LDNSLYYQFRAIVVYFISGLSIGFTFDFFRAQRKIIKVSDIITYIQDILFWIISGIIIIITTITFTDGQIRSFMIMGLILGLVIYFYLFSKYILEIEIRFSKYIAKALSIFIYPFRNLIKKLKKAGKKWILCYNVCKFNKLYWRSTYEKKIKGR